MEITRTCPHGHPLTLENILVWRSNGGKIRHRCRTCEEQRNRMPKRKAAMRRYNRKWRSRDPKTSARAVERIKMLRSRNGEPAPRPDELGHLRAIAARARLTPAQVPAQPPKLPLPTWEGLRTSLNATTARQGFRWGE